MTETEARQQILEIVSLYCDIYHFKIDYSEGEHIAYASRYYDHEELVNLVDSALEFWLTRQIYGSV
jgi:CDP-6-deoxy-D-xylo-4-hexulose-3-dehydrase